MISIIFFFSAIILAFIYMILSIRLNMPSGVFIASASHLIMGIFSLPSIGLFILALAFIEFSLGVYTLIQKRFKERERQLKNKHVRKRPIKRD
ncbi:MAG TPA: hypothetical protein VK125_08770 [Bacillota bacterium]|nr:hypothetical protein [Bacillota bacterium]